MPSASRTSTSERASPVLGPGISARQRGTEGGDFIVEQEGGKGGAMGQTRREI